MLRRSLNGSRRPLALAVAHGRHACVRLSTAAAAPVKLPRFLVTTVAPLNLPENKPDIRDGSFVGKFEFTSECQQSSKGLPVFLTDVTYEGKTSVTDEDMLKKGKVYVGTAVTQAEFTQALASQEEDLVFFIHGYSVQTKDMVISTDKMQNNFDKKALVVPVDWACADKPMWYGAVPNYSEDQESAEEAGRLIGKFLLSDGLQSASNKLNIVAHSMGNRVLRCVGKSAVSEDAAWDVDALQSGESLMKAAPEVLKNKENLFDNIFFVSADIPETVFNEPTDGTQGQQSEHALKSGVAALAVMAKRMHVLHADGWDKALNASWTLNGGNGRLGSRGPHTGGPFTGKSTKVWDKIGEALEDNGAAGVDETKGNANNNNVLVQDCSKWNTENDWLGHSYQCDPKSVEYYRKHMK